MIKAQVKKTGNAPALYINGKRVPPVLFGLSDFPAARPDIAYAQKNIGEFAKAGINPVALDANLCQCFHKVTPPTFEHIIAEVASMVKANPNAYALIRLHVNPPYWWLRDNPDECMVYKIKGEYTTGIDDGEQDRVISFDCNHHLRGSLASKKWIKDISELIRLFIKELDASPFGDHVFAIQVASGCYGEWHPWAIDYSKPAVDHFHSYLKETYKTDKALQKAWGRSDVTIKNAPFDPDGDWLHDVAAYDAAKSLQRIMPEAILEFCKVIKQECPNRLCGAFFGYYFNCGEPVRYGHVEVDMLLNAEGIIDFLCGPFAYYTENRQIEGVPLQRGLLESCRLHNVLWLTEMDQHPIGTEDMVGGDPKQYPETIALLRRNFLQPLLAGQGMWYYDHRVIPKLLKGKNVMNSGSIYFKNGWWGESKPLMKEIAKLQALAKERMLGKYNAAADVLLVFDIKDCYARKTSKDTYIGDPDYYQLIDPLARCSVAYDCIYATDLPLADLSRYKCVIKMEGEVGAGMVDGREVKTEEEWAKIFAEKGVHRYTDVGDPIIAGFGLIAISHSPRTEKNTFNLILSSGKKIKIRLKSKETAAFDAKTGERVL